MKLQITDRWKRRLVKRDLLVALAVLLAIPTSFPTLFTGSALALASPIERVSVDSSGTQTSSGTNTAGSAGVTISRDGRYATFTSTATNLVASDTNGFADVFLRDRQTGLTTRISTDSSGTEATGGDSNFPNISADGRFVSFQSDATNLVASDTNSAKDVFVKDLQAGTTTRVSTDSSGTQSSGGALTTGDAFISADGRYVAFQSSATNLVAGDTNAKRDIFLKDTQTGTTTRVSTDSSGAESNDDSSGPVISPDGRYVGFQSTAWNLVAGDTNATTDIFLKDTQTGVTTRQNTDSSGTQGSGGSSGNVFLSDNVRYVFFGSTATNLVASDTNAASDVFVKDRQTGTTTRLSTDSSGAQATGGGSATPNVSADGRYVAFESTATNLVASDTNALTDVFVKDTQTGTTTRVSTDSSGTQSTGGTSTAAFLSADAHYLLFMSNATNLVSSDTNGASDLFVKTLSDPGLVGPQPIGRSLRVTTSKKSATGVSWIFSFQMPSGASPLQSIRLQFCTTAIGTCTQPTGLDVSGYGVASQTFTQATTFATQSGNLAQCTAATNPQFEACVKRTQTGNEAAAPDQKVLTLNGITNPSVTGAVFVRITLYGNSGITAAGRIGDGAVATAIVNQLSVNARVQEKLVFCVGAVPSSVVSDATTPANCSDSAFNGSNQSVDIGTVDSSTTAVSPVSNVAGGNDTNGAVMISTNAVNGATIAYFAEQAVSGSNHLGALRVPGASCSAGVSSTDQCFNSAGGTQISFSGSGEKFGMTASAVYRPTGSTTTNLTRDTNYDGDGTAAVGFAWDDSGAAATLATSSTVMDYEMLLLRFAARAASTTPTGAYTVLSTYIATASY